MKNYSKIVGVIMTLGFLTSFFLIFVLINVVDSGEKIFAGLFFIPCIAFLYFMYLHNFGFSLNSDIPKKNYKVILVLSIISVFLSALPSVYFIGLENKKQKERLSKIELAGDILDLGEYLASDNSIKYSLKVKFDLEQVEMLYQFSVENFDKKGNLNERVKSFTIELQDKDGFNIKEIKIPTIEMINNVGSQRQGNSKLSKNSSVFMPISEFVKISSFKISYIERL